MVPTRRRGSLASPPLKTEQRALGFPDLYHQNPHSFKVWACRLERFKGCLWPFEQELWQFTWFRSRWLRVQGRDTCRNLKLSFFFFFITSGPFDNFFYTGENTTFYTHLNNQFIKNEYIQLCCISLCTGTSNKFCCNVLSFHYMPVGQTHSAFCQWHLFRAKSRPLISLVYPVFHWRPIKFFWKLGWWHLAGNDKGIIEIKDAMNEAFYPHCTLGKKRKASSDIIKWEKHTWVKGINHSSRSKATWTSHPEDAGVRTIPVWEITVKMVDGTAWVLDATTTIW